MGSILPPNNSKRFRTEDHCSDSSLLQSMPRALLEMMIVHLTSTEEKKALRQTCKLFRQTLDGTLISTELRYYDRKDHRSMEKFLQSMQHVQCFRGLSITSPRVVGINRSNLFKQLPSHLQTLTVYGQPIRPKLLCGLRDLTPLSILTPMQHVENLEYISGLTRLHVERLIGYLGNLAPKLKHLSIWLTTDAIGTNTLTNLEVLDVGMEAPEDLFVTHSKLPLRHLGLYCLHNHNRPFLEKPSVWAAAPSTLTCLTLYGVDNIEPGVLPASITSLRLIGICLDVLEKAAAALPAIKSLEISLCVDDVHDSCTAFNCLSKLTNLQCLRLCVDDSTDLAQQRHWLLSRLPAVALAVTRGVRLDILQDDVDFMFLKSENLRWKSANPEEGSQYGSRSRVPMLEDSCTPGAVLTCIRQTSFDCAVSSRMVWPLSGGTLR